MIQTLIKHFEIPEKCFLNKTLFKKLFQENADLDITDKKALKDDIEKIRWLYTLKPSTINIEPYTDDERIYDEVAILQIDLTSQARAKRIASFMNKAIPYPLVLLFSFNDLVSVGVSDKRINQADKSKWVVEDIWLTDWFNPDAPNEAQQAFMQDMAVKNLSFVNFFAFYTDIKNRLIALNTSARSGHYQVGSAEKTEGRREGLTRIAELEREITELRSSLKKETQFNKKLELNVSVKERQQAIKQLEQSL